MKFGAARFWKGQQICVLVSPEVWTKARVLICTCDDHTEESHASGPLRDLPSKVVSFIGDEWFVLWDHLGEVPKAERDPALRLLLDIKLELGGKLQLGHIRNAIEHRNDVPPPKPVAGLPFNSDRRPPQVEMVVDPPSPIVIDRGVPDAAVAAAHQPSARELLLARLRKASP